MLTKELGANLGKKMSDTKPRIGHFLLSSLRC